jgi:Na+/proline symporter
MVAAMSSATASTATTVLNVYAGAFTTEFYQRIFRPKATEGELVLVGRLITIALGGIVVAGALLIPRLGSYTGWILTTTAMLTGPLVLPTIWGLFSRKIGLGAAWTVTLVSAAAGFLVKFGFGEDGWLDGAEAWAGLCRLAQENSRVTEIVIGVGVPLLMLMILELLVKKDSPGWARMEERRGLQRDAVAVLPSRMPAQLCGWSVLGLGTLIFALSFGAGIDQLLVAGFGGSLAAIGGVISWLVRGDGK